MAGGWSWCRGVMAPGGCSCPETRVPVFSGVFHLASFTGLPFHFPLPGMVEVGISSFVSGSCGDTLYEQDDGDEDEK